MRVTPCVGVWIETCKNCIYEKDNRVTPCVGVWIETEARKTQFRLQAESHPAWVCGLKQRKSLYIFILITSHPAWVCGLKLLIQNPLYIYWSHTLRGCVDWNFIPVMRKKHCRCHTLRGCVDWNLAVLPEAFFVVVTPCVGVWIETDAEKMMKNMSVSHPAWVCGLKPLLVTSWSIESVVTPCVGVWIETNSWGCP